MDSVMKAQTEHWYTTDCTCGNGNAAPKHFFRCAKWLKIFQNHGDDFKQYEQV